MKTLVRSIRKLTSRLVVGMVLMSSQVAFAVLPTPAPPSRGAATSGNYIQGAQEYIFDFFILAGLVLATLGLIFVVRNTLSTYAEVPQNRATMSEVFMQAGVGAVIVVFIIWLLTEASTIL